MLVTSLPLRFVKMSAFAQSRVLSGQHWLQRRGLPSSHRSTRAWRLSAPRADAQRRGLRAPGRGEELVGRLTTPCAINRPLRLEPLEEHVVVDLEGLRELLSTLLTDGSLPCSISEIGAGGCQ